MVNYSALSHCIFECEDTRVRNCQGHLKVLGNIVKDEYSPVPRTEVWSNVAENCTEAWNFPNFMGCVDGKRGI
jgi:flavin reductase (DIM6/NTAB) family NADH-FMN oxidoreductase RutF